MLQTLHFKLYVCEKFSLERHIHLQTPPAVRNPSHARHPVPRAFVARPRRLLSPNLKSWITLYIEQWNQLSLRSDNHILFTLLLVHGHQYPVDVPVSCQISVPFVVDDIKIQYNDE